MEKNEPEFNGDLTYYALKRQTHRLSMTAPPSGGFVLMEWEDKGRSLRTRAASVRSARLYWMQ
jgi:hypothetical protein